MNEIKAVTHQVMYGQRIRISPGDRENIMILEMV
jgi:hypothetical protein